MVCPACAHGLSHVCAWAVPRVHIIGMCTPAVPHVHTGCPADVHRLPHHLCTPAAPRVHTGCPACAHGLPR
eukprot:744845-Prorocentrum_minimum.AAC.1